MVDRHSTYCSRMARQLCNFNLPKFLEVPDHALDGIHLAIGLGLGLA